ncbi:MAG: integrin alpha, partial [Candidatus Dojkabacteria bacterium]|nr:integrin alpha [Candidatus Dojkabacteria bacterium]
EGIVHLFFGKGGGWNMDNPLTSADASFVGENEWDNTGYGISSQGDLNGDGANDLVIGSTGYPDGFWDGKVYVLLGPAYTINNLPLGLSPVLLTDFVTDLSVIPRAGTLGVYVMKDGMIIAETSVLLSEDRDWSGVNGDIDPLNRKSVITGLEDAPGAASGHSLYVIKGATDDTVAICPEAATLEEVTVLCPGITYEQEENVEVVMVNGVEYWKISNQTGTGGLSLQLEDSTLPETGFNIMYIFILVSFMMIVPIVSLIIKRSNHFVKCSRIG